jgi:hypothetical protein
MRRLADVNLEQSGGFVKSAGYPTLQSAAALHCLNQVLRRVDVDKRELQRLCFVPILWGAGDGSQIKESRTAL